VEKIVEKQRFSGTQGPEYLMKGTFCQGWDRKVTNFNGLSGLS
jgi:hypothetical protein